MRDKNCNYGRDGTLAWNLGICKMARYYPAFSG
jgi:hypothetical protein